MKGRSYFALIVQIQWLTKSHPFHFLFYCKKNASYLLQIAKFWHVTYSAPRIVSLLKCENFQVILNPTSDFSFNTNLFEISAKASHAFDFVEFLHSVQNWIFIIVIPVISKKKMHNLLMKHVIPINRIKRLQYSNLKLHMDELTK